MHLHDKSSEVCIKTRSTPASLSFKGQVTEQITVKWSIAVKWSSVVCEQCAKANKLLGFVRRTSAYTVLLYRPVPSRLRNPSLVATENWLLKRLENVQRCATKLILRLPFRSNVTYKTRRQLTNLLPISYWHEFLDIVFFYKAVNNSGFIDSEALPVT